MVSADVATAGQPIVLPDAIGDTVLRRTDENDDGPINPASHVLPDIIEMRLGTFSPNAPSLDLFAGEWDATGGFFRFDLVVAQLVNPPGPLYDQRRDGDGEAFRYGPNPILGWIEFDMDADVDTGGELEYPEYRYNGNVGRFGGFPSGARFVGRLAQDALAFDEDVRTPPSVDRSGEEFHLVFSGESADWIEEIFVLVERPGGDPEIFEDGEEWVLRSRPWHLAHGFEEFAAQCPNNSGHYEPLVSVRFLHDPASATTTISLVYPRTNAASASMVGPQEPTQSNDPCAYNQNSIEEALEDLKFTATQATPLERTLPEFQLIAGWESKNVSDHLDSAAWGVTALIGTTYESPQENDALYIWTDVFPNCRMGDFNGDGASDAVDVALLNAYIDLHDGDPRLDDDEDPQNGIILLEHFAAGFSVFDTNYDGVVEPADAVLPGDMDQDQAVGGGDADDFVLGILDPAAYASGHGGMAPLFRGDLNEDGRLDGRDIGLFVQLLLNGR